jgi:RNA polymerase sigma-70 factor, ECF subfamily
VITHPGKIGLHTSEKTTLSHIRKDEELWLAFQGGEDDAYNILYHRYSDRLYSYLKLLLSGSLEQSQVDDLFQETWICVFRERSRFTIREGGSFAGWLFRVGHNFAISAIRRTRHTSSLDDLYMDEATISAISVEPIEMSFGSLTTEDVMEKVLHVVAELPLMLKEVFLLIEFDHLSLDQAAESLGITKTNAKVRLFRARRAIREKLSKVIDISGLRF